MSGARVELFNYDPVTSKFHGALVSIPWNNITGKPSTFAPAAHTHPISEVTLLQAALDAKAPLASPALTGTPTGPTAAPGTNTTQLSTTAFVQAALAALVDSSPAALDTLNELAAALGDDPNFATTVTNTLATKITQVQGDARYAQLAAANLFTLQQNFRNGFIFTNSGNVTQSGMDNIGRIFIGPSAQTSLDTNVQLAVRKDHDGAVRNLVYNNNGTTSAFAQFQAKANSNSAYLGASPSGDSVTSRGFVSTDGVDFGVYVGGTRIANFLAAGIVLESGKTFVQGSTTIIDTDGDVINQDINIVDGRGWDGGGSALTTGAAVIIYIRLGQDCTANGWALAADASGSAVVDIWYSASGLPTVANTITGSNKPTLSSQQVSTGNVTGWSVTQFAKDGWLALKLDSTATIKWLSLTLPGVTR